MRKIGAKIFVNSITMLRLIGTFLMPIICINMNPKDIIFYLIKITTYYLSFLFQLLIYQIPKQIFYLV